MKNNINLYKKKVSVQLFNILVIGVLSFCLASCRDNASEFGKDPEEIKDASSLKFSLSVTLPTTVESRSETDHEGDPADKDKQNGIDNENIIDNLTLYFNSYEEVVPDDASDGDISDEDNDVGDDSDETEKQYEEKFLFTLTTSSSINFNGKDKQIVHFDISLEDLQKLAGKEVVRIYAEGNIGQNFSFRYGNFDPMDAEWGELEKLYDYLKEFPSATASGELNGIKTPVAGSEYYEVNFEGLSGDDLYFLIHDTEHGDEYKRIYKEVNDLLENKCIQSTLTLERCFARIDFNDLSNGKFVYPLVNSDEKCNVYVKLVSMTPFNISRGNYLLRHTSSGDITGGNYIESNGVTAGHFDISVFGKENENPNLGSTVSGENIDPTAYRWIADPNWVYKKNKSADWDNVAYAPSTYYYNTPDYETQSITTEREYNSIQVSDLINSKNYHYTVGNKDYFPWRYLPENTHPSTSAMLRGLTTGIGFKVLFCDANGDTYKDVNDIKDYLETYFKEVKLDQIDTTNQYNLTLDGETAILTVEPDNQLSLTYFYFFRHNIMSTHKEGIMDPMQFALVRNNIYRISVAGFNGLPRPFDPKEPDEPIDDNCIAVDLKVLAWAKHDIHVNF